MERHPIHGLMDTTMESIRDMVDVNTVLGDAIVAQDGSTVVPVSKVSFGFVAGGGEYASNTTTKEDYPFAGGAGAGVTIQPVGFLVCGDNHVRMLPAQNKCAADRVMELIPGVMEELKCVLERMNAKREQKEPKEQQKQKEQRAKGAPAVPHEGALPEVPAE